MILPSSNKPYDNQIQELKHENAVLNHEYDIKNNQVFRANQQLDNLQLQLSEYQDFIESIPEELRNELLARYQQMQDQGQNYTL